MRLGWMASAAMLAAGPLWAQDEDFAGPPRAETAPGAMLRALDRVDGRTEDIELAIGETGRFGPLSIVLAECRYPEGNPALDAYAWLEIRDRNSETPTFSGWMIASSPALSAMDHPRYDVWVIRCSSS